MTLKSGKHEQTSKSVRNLNRRLITPVLGPISGTQNKPMKIIVAGKKVTEYRVRYFITNGSFLV